MTVLDRHGAVVPARRPVRRVRSLSVLTGGALAFAAFVIILAIIGPTVAPQGPSVEHLLVGVSSPSGAHWLGTDQLGRDVLSRLIAGARPAVLGSVVVAIGAMVLGNILGLLSGYAGGWRDGLIMRIVDVVYSLPALIVAVVVVGVVGASYALTLAVLVFLFTPNDTRIVRAAVLEQRGLPYVEAARIAGVGSVRIMVRHIWPNLRWLVLAQTLLTLALALVTMSSLSFLGLGVPPGTPDWGAMLADGQQIIFNNPAATFGPGAMIALTAASMTLVGDWIEEVLGGRGRA